MSTWLRAFPYPEISAYGVTITAPICKHKDSLCNRPRAGRCLHSADESQVLHGILVVAELRFQVSTHAKVEAEALVLTFPVICLSTLNTRHITQSKWPKLHA